MYPYGMLMDGRHATAGSQYRYGFQGQEMDDEVKGKGNSYGFEARIYDPRVARWLSGDPHEFKYPSLSPYNFVANMPLKTIDPDGRDIIIPKEYRKAMRPIIRKLKKSKVFKAAWKRLDSDHDITVKIVTGNVGSEGALGTMSPNFGYQTAGLKKPIMKIVDGKLTRVGDEWVVEPSYHSVDRGGEIVIDATLWANGTDIEKMVVLAEEVFHAAQYQLQFSTEESVNNPNFTRGLYGAIVTEWSGKLFNNEMEAKLLVAAMIKESFDEEYRSDPGSGFTGDLAGAYAALDGYSVVTIGGKDEIDHDSFYNTDGSLSELNYCTTGYHDLLFNFRHEGYGSIMGAYFNEINGSNDPTINRSDGSDPELYNSIINETNPKLSSPTGKDPVFE